MTSAARLAAWMVTAGLACVGAGAPRDSVTYTAVASNGTLGAGTNSVLTWAPANTPPYQVGRIVVSGTLTKVHASTFASEARIHVTPPTGEPFVLQPFTVGSFTGSLVLSPTVYTGPFMPPRPAGGTWTFRFFEGVDDGGSSVDSIWDTITFTLDDQAEPPPSPPAAIDLGTLNVGTTISRGDAIGPGQVLWYRFTLGSDVTTSGPSYLDIDTNGSSLPGSISGNDTEIAVFSGSYGVLNAENDDGGQDAASQLSYGGGRRLGIDETALNYAGQQGSLLVSGNTYYLAASAFNAVFGSGFSASSTHVRSGTIRLNVRMSMMPCGPADLNKDGEIDFSDIEAFLNLYNQGCTP